MSAPLAGLRVIELARILAGPWAGQTLADLGADVIKVEAPEGDDTRRWGPPFIDHGGERYRRLFPCDQPRQAVDHLRFPHGRGAGDGAPPCRRRRCGDRELQGRRPGEIRARLCRASRAVNPRLIYCSITGFGQTGPYAHRAGYDYIIQGMAGLMSVTGEPDGQPHEGGRRRRRYLHRGLCHHRDPRGPAPARGEPGAGQQIDMALLDVATSIMANQAMNYLATGKPPDRWATPTRTSRPMRSSTAPMAGSSSPPAMTRSISASARILGLPALATAPEYLTNADRIANRAALTAALTAATTRWTKADLLAACEAEGVPAGPINDMAEVFADPQVIAPRHADRTRGHARRPLALHLLGRRTCPGPRRAPAGRASGRGAGLTGPHPC